MNSEECSGLDTISAAMILFNNGYVGHYDDNSSMMGNTLQMTIQPSTTKYAICYYFSSTFEVSVAIKPLQR